MYAVESSRQSPSQHACPKLKLRRGQCWRCLLLFRCTIATACLSMKDMTRSKAACLERFAHANIRGPSSESRPPKPMNPEYAFPTDVTSMCNPGSCHSGPKRPALIEKPASRTSSVPENQSRDGTRAADRTAVGGSKTMDMVRTETGLSAGSLAAKHQ